ncbi:hypothetical protein ERJ75_001625400 [Trypanosoma vivax]|nr:hypothetical protein ERJ75_001625400 [Trypanosoma vivax]
MVRLCAGGGQGPPVLRAAIRCVRVPPTNGVCRRAAPGQSCPRGAASASAAASSPRCVCWGRLVLGQVSGLEAFSREPPCDSVGALAARQAPETRGTAWAFLSYCPILPSRRRRDPFQSRSFSHKRGDRAKRVPPGPAQDDRLPREAVRVPAISS